MWTRPSLFVAAAALTGAALTGCQSSQSDHDADTTTTVMTDSAVEGTEAINNMCPVGREAVTAESPTSTYKGHSIAFCCDSCAGEFMKWDESARDRWLVAALRNPDYVP